MLIFLDTDVVKSNRDTDPEADPIGNLRSLKLYYFYYLLYGIVWIALLWNVLFLLALIHIYAQNQNK